MKTPAKSSFDLFLGAVKDSLPTVTLSGAEFKLRHLTPADYNHIKQLLEADARAEMAQMPSDYATLPVSEVEIQQWKATTGQAGGESVDLSPVVDLLGIGQLKTKQDHAVAMYKIANFFHYQAALSLTDMEGKALETAAVKDVARAIGSKPEYMEAINKAMAELRTGQDEKNEPADSGTR
jgi:hypothetical protein